MKIISPANDTVLQMLKNFKKAGENYRFLKYTVHMETEDGVLLFNMFTRELVHLDIEEFHNATQNGYLRDQWFVVPEGCQEKEYVDLVKTYLKMRQKNTGEITGYTIFTTTDCNARCFYCFELGRSRIPMSRETAEKTARYIKGHCAGNKVNITWFGGEPLMNTEAIDTICNYLAAEEIIFKSQMVSNGYLFTDELVCKAVKEWHLKKVQITLDGTEAVYNKIKAFVYKGVNPYQTVIANIDRLLDASIQVSIRLNMDLHNAENLLELATELAEKFGGRAGIGVYAHHLFQENVTMADQHTSEEWDLREAAMKRIENVLNQHGLAYKSGISNKLKINHCMADSGHSVTILPDGNIGLCEHFSEGEFIGHLDKEGFDQTVVNSFKETIPQISECNDCFYYTDCIMLKKCSNSSKCYPQLRNSLLRSTQRKMVNQYEAWKSGKETEPDEDFEEEPT